MEGENLSSKEKTGSKTTAAEKHPTDPNHPENPADTEAVSTGVGVVAGGATGAAIGTAVAGPIGTVVGAVVGAVAGGFGGQAVGKAIDKDAEENYWREHHARQPYAKAEDRYEDYHPAYQTAYEGYERHQGTAPAFEQAEPALRSDYEAKGASLPWEQASYATRAAWDRIQSGEAVRIPLSEEQVTVGKREVEAGAVRVRKEVHTETVQQPVELKREEIVVERVPAGSETVPEDAFREQEVRIPIKQEEPVVEKHTVVTGQVEIRKDAVSETENVSETVRREEIKTDEEQKP